MMNDNILELLTSDNPQQRKRGIGAAAKTTDPRYLKPLGRLYQSDPDDELRLLAKKAGVYIKKHQPAPTPAGATPTPSPDAPAASLAPSMDDLLGVSGDETEDREAAEVHYNVAFQHHLKGRDAKAVVELGTAFRLNPDYASDKTAVALAAELTGQPAHRAAAHIADESNWEALVAKYGGLQTTAEERENLQQLLMWIAGAVGIVVLIGLGLAFVNGPMFDAIMDEFGQSIRSIFPGGGGATGLGGMLPPLLR